MPVACSAEVLVDFVVDSRGLDIAGVISPRVFCPSDRIDSGTFVDLLRGGDIDLVSVDKKADRWALICSA